MLTCIAQLIDSRELRLRMGEAAKAEALRRFDGEKFREALLAAYQAPLTQVS
jgi:glycosyltransferase involved in cell wall biosynthesis